MKSCDNCKHKDLPPLKPTCRLCHDHKNWKTAHPANTIEDIAKGILDDLLNDDQKRMLAEANERTDYNNAKKHLKAPKRKQQKWWLVP